MNRNNLKIVFFGTPDFATQVLKKLLDSRYNVSGVFAGHGPAELEAKKHGIKVFSPASLRQDEQVFETFKLLNPNLCIVVAYGKILPLSYLEIPKYGFLNVHSSILPKYRGPSPIQTAILNGDTETGVSIMTVDVEVDHGPILANAPYEIPDSKYYIEIAQNIFELGARLLVEILPKYINGEIKLIKQDHDQATFTKKFNREDGRINWSESSDKIYNQVRALNPEPGTWTTWKGKVINISNVTTRRVVSPQVINMTSSTLGVPGMVRKIGKDITIETKTDYLIPILIQLEGRKKIDAKSFVNGHSDFLGSILK